MRAVELCAFLFKCVLFIISKKNPLLSTSSLADCTCIVLIFTDLSRFRCWFPANKKKDPPPGAHPPSNPALTEWVFVPSAAAAGVFEFESQTFVNVNQPARALPLGALGANKEFARVVLDGERSGRRAIAETLRKLEAGRRADGEELDPAEQQKNLATVNLVLAFLTPPPFFCIAVVVWCMVLLSLVSA